MKPIPISVWLSAIVLFVYSFNCIWNTPAAFFEALIFFIICASFGRLLYWFIKEYYEQTN